MGGESQPSTIRWHQDRVREMKPQSDFNANRLDSNHKLHYLYSRQLFFPHKMLFLLKAISATNHRVRGGGAFSTEKISLKLAQKQCFLSTKMSDVR